MCSSGTPIKNLHYNDLDKFTLNDIWILEWSQFFLVPMLPKKYLFKCGQKWPKKLSCFLLKDPPDFKSSTSTYKIPLLIWSKVTQKIILLPIVQSLIWKVASVFLLRLELNS
jgi:hypothetical protein